MALNPPHASIQSPLNRHDSPASPRKSPIRRVLGELTPNTRSVPPIARDDPIKSPTTSPSKRSGPVTPADVLSEKHRLEDEEQEEELAVESRKRHLGTILDAPGSKKRRQDSSWGRAVPAIVRLDTGSTTEPDSPPSEEGLVVKGLKADEGIAKPKGSFSSLIDYDPSTASDKEHEPSVSPSGEELENPFEVNIKSRAEMLRLRLRVAMYKVRTGQTNLPMSSIQLVQPEATSPSRDNIPAEINTNAQPRPNRLGLLPAPVLMPTAYSSRFIGAPSAPVARVMSSPPSRYASPRAGMLGGESSPVSLPQPITRVSSPLKHVSSVTPAGRRVLESDGDLTSSAVKGRAASGLLELMRGR